MPWGKQIRLESFPAPYKGCLRNVQFCLEYRPFDGNHCEHSPTDTRLWFTLFDGSYKGKSLGLWYVLRKVGEVEWKERVAPFFAEMHACHGQLHTLLACNYMSKEPPVCKFSRCPEPVRFPPARNSSQPLLHETRVFFVSFFFPPTSHTLNDSVVQI